MLRVTRQDGLDAQHGGASALSFAGSFCLDGLDQDRDASVLGRASAFLGNFGNVMDCNGGSRAASPCEGREPLAPL